MSTGHTSRVSERRGGTGPVGEDPVEGHPGFVDLQINGVADIDFWVADSGAWRAAGAALVPMGTTSYLATLPTGPLDAYDAALDRIAARDKTRPRGVCRGIEGVHLEGPFLGAAPGAHPPELVRPMDVEWLTGVVDRHPGLVRLVTLAPEADPGFDGIAALVERDVLVALGHSRCSFDDACAAAEAGASIVTHVFNGMAPMHHRDPGLAGAALDPSVDLVPTLIADGVHVHCSLVAAVVELGCILVTDAVATGVEHFGRRVEARDGAAYLDDGTLTGSTLTMDRAVANVAAWTGSADRAVVAASDRPARMLRLGPRAGDRVTLDRETAAVRGVWIAGEHVYGS